MAMPFLQANGSTDRFLSSLWTKDQMEEVRRWVRIGPYEYSNDGKVRMVKMMKTKGVADASGGMGDSGQVQTAL